MSPTQYADAFPDDQIAQIAFCLGIQLPSDLAYLTKRLQRFAVRYSRLRKHDEIVPHAADARAQLGDAVKLAKQLRAAVHGLDFVDELRVGFRQANVGLTQSDRRSLATLRHELSAFEAAARFAAERTATKSGPKPDHLLRSMIEALMAVIERTAPSSTNAGLRDVERTDSRYKAIEGAAIQLYFKHVDRSLNTRTISRAASEVRKARAGKPLRIGVIDVVGELEDGAEISLRTVELA